MNVKHSEQVPLRTQTSQDVKRQVCPPTTAINKYQIYTFIHLPAEELGLILQHRERRAGRVLHLQEGGAVELARLLVRDPLDEGDAARDRKEALSSLNNAKPSTDDSENAGDFEDAVVNEGCTDCVSGSGFFYYPRLADLANRFGTNAQKRKEEIFKKYGLKVTVQ